jgi:hypothetical protein
VDRFYHDYQLFVKKPESVSKDKLREYFQQFGEVVDIAELEFTEQKSHGHNYCYIKMKDDKVIDGILLAKLHKLNEKDEVRVKRTFGIGEDRESDKKLFMKVDGTLESL